MDAQNSSRGLPRGQWSLMGGWRDIAEDTRALAELIEGVPDACRCADASGALCACCRDDQGRRECKRCRRLLDDVTQRVDELAAAVRRFMPVVAAVVARTIGQDTSVQLTRVTAGAFAAERALLRIDIPESDFS